MHIHEPMVFSKISGKACQMEIRYPASKKFARVCSCFSERFVKCPFHPRPRARRSHFAQFKVQEPGPRWHRRYRFGPWRSRIRTVADFSGQARTRYQHSSVSVTSAIDAARCFISSILLIPSKLRFALSGRRDSNPRPLEPHSSALPSCATARFF